MVENIRYGKIEGGKGKILFDHNGKTFSITEPDDVILTDPNTKEQAKKYITTRYSALLGKDENKEKKNWESKFERNRG